MNVHIGVPEVPALPVGTGVALRVDAFGSTSPTFDFTPGMRHPQALHLTREERPDDRPGNHLGCGA